MAWGAGEAVVETLLVVSDTSPIRALHHLDLLGILQTLFESVLIPPAVERELHGRTRVCPPIDIAAFPFIQLRAPLDQAFVKQLSVDLDAGEAEAIVLAKEVDADLLLIDEMRARAFAKRIQIKITGALGVLLLAKASGLISQVVPLVDRLQNEIDFFVADELRHEVIRRAGEA
jgi:predicted nucleic acid-binding protein